MATRTYFENRVRFNWAYWDGAAEERRGQPNRCCALDSHPDATYRHGYLLGYSDSAAHTVGDTSEPAWQWAVTQHYVTDDRAA